MRNTIPVMMLAAILAIVLPLAIAQQSGETPQEDQEERVAKSKDPVCNMVVVNDPDLSAEHGGKVYYFCMKRDLETFEENPEKYLEGEGYSHADAELHH